MSLPASDAFTGTGALSASWTVQLGSPSRSSDVFIGTGGSESTAKWNADTFANDQYSQCVLASGQNWGGPSVRCSAAGSDMYWYVGSAGAGVLYKRVSGGYTSLGAINIAAGHTAKLEAVGTTITLYDNGVSAGAATDSGLASGSAGLGVYIGNSPTLDDWQGDNVGGAAGPTAAQMIGIFDQQLSGGIIGRVDA